MLKKLKYKKLDYILKEPDCLQSGKKYPVVFFLHGAGTRGNDIDALEKNPYFTLTKAHEDMDFITFAPQCYTNTWFDIFEQLGDFLEYITTCEFVDCNRIYGMGASMGGYGIWQMAMSHPEIFAAIVVICGGGMYWNTHRLKNMGVWAFHGENDEYVLCEESKKMVEHINSCGGNAKLTIYKDTAHDAWTATYKNREIFEWLLKYKKPDNEKINKDGFNNQAMFG